MFVCTVDTTKSLPKINFKLIYFPPPVNIENNQIRIPTTTTIAKMPTKTPALKIPVITEQPLKAIIAKRIREMFNFFMV